MKHRSARPFMPDLSRARRLIEAGQLSPDQALAAEADIARDVVGDDVVSRDVLVRPSAHPSTRHMSAFEATATLARELHRVIAEIAVASGKKAPATRQYDLRLVTPTIFSELWRGRQVIDELAMPIRFYVEVAAAYWADQGKKRVPRVSQMFTPDAITHVMEAWATQSLSAGEAA